MNTVTAKELRDNLGDIAKRVSAGEHIYVSYRNSVKFKLEPVADHREQSRKKFAGLEALQKAQKTATIPEKYKSGNLKKLYRQDVAKKYGIDV